MEKIKLTYSHNGAVANILLDDEKGNILDNTMMLEILDCCADFRDDNNLKLITFQGAGMHYSFGASVPEHTKECAEAMLKTFHKIFTTLMDMGIPTLSKISGQCLGGGMELALFSNFMFGDKTAVMGQPEIVLGVFPPPASIMLPLKIGNAWAEDILLTGRSVKADEALRIGLLNRVFEDQNELNAETDNWIEKFILPKSASSLRYGVKTARTTFNYIMGNKLPILEYMYINQLMETKDANEGINSFLEKREPIWENC